MQKRVKRLSLTRETLRNLQGSELEKAGGASAYCTSAQCIVESQCECGSPYTKLCTRNCDTIGC